MKTLRFLILSEMYPEAAWERETKASPRPSKRPRAAMFAFRIVVTKRGQMG